MLPVIIDVSQLSLAIIGSGPTSAAALANG